MKQMINTKLLKRPGYYGKTIIEDPLLIGNKCYIRGVWELTYITELVDTGSTNSLGYITEYNPMKIYEKWDLCKTKNLSYEDRIEIRKAKISRLFD